MKWNLIKKRIVTESKRVLNKIYSRIIIMGKNKKIKKILIVGTLILTVGTSIFVIGKNTFFSPSDKEPAVIVKEFDEEKEKANMYMEHVDAIKNGLKKTKKLMFAEEQIRVMEKYGIDSKNNVTVEAVFDTGYSIKLDNFSIRYNKKTDTIDVIVDSKDVGLEKVNLNGTIKETAKNESLGNKIMDWIPGFNDNEKMKENAINQLMKNAKIEADRPFSDLEEGAKKCLEGIIKDFNTDNIKVNVQFKKGNNVK